jgi:hypothetical protein
MEHLNTEILESNIYEIIDKFCDDLITNITNYYILKAKEYTFRDELFFIIIYIKNDFINKEYEYSTCQCFESSICIADKEKCNYDIKKFIEHIQYIKNKYLNISNILAKFINIFRYIYYKDKKYNSRNSELLNEYIMIIIYGLYNLWNTINNIALYINSFRQNFKETNEANFTIAQLIIFLNYKKEIKQRYFYSNIEPIYKPEFNFKLMDQFIIDSTDTNISLYKFAATDILSQYNSIIIPSSMLRGGKNTNKYKNMKTKITVIYNKKKYTRVIYICERKKYVKIDKTFMLLSKLKKV